MVTQCIFDNTGTWKYGGPIAGDNGHLWSRSISDKASRVSFIGMPPPYTTVHAPASVALDPFIC